MLADNDENYDNIYLDFSKAFDKVPHERLLNKFRAHGINEKVHRWIGSWLSDRQQRVTINDSKSKLGMVTRWVPQGSVLGPLVFLICINDLDSVSSSDIADNYKISTITRSDSDVKDLQGDIDRLNEWVVRWQMEFSIDKCSVMNVGNLEGKTLTTGTT